MTLRKSTKVWIGIFVLGIGVIALDRRGGGDRLGAIAIPFWLGCIAAAAFLAARATAVAFRLIVHRLTLRLAFSYFLIGIVPIPLLAFLLCLVGYLVANQVMGSKVLREAEALAEAARAGSPGVLSARAAGGSIVESEAPWLPAGSVADWAARLEAPRPVVVNKHVWMVCGREERGSLRLIFLLLDPARLGEIARRTGYSVRLQAGSTRGRSDRRGLTVGPAPGKGPAPSTAKPGVDLGMNDDKADAWAKPGEEANPNPARGILDSSWLGGFRLEPAAASFEPAVEKPVAVFLARTSPRVFARQLFRQGLPEVGGVLLAVLAALAGSLLFVYLIALIIAFVLVGTITRNVNKLTRAAQAIGRGDFAVRVNSRSREQIGDLARSFDAMAGSIQRLLLETAKKEKIDAELSVARAIQRSLLPESGESWPGFRVVSHFEPVAEVGGDFYDVVATANGATAVVLGDVSGHGLPTGLIASAARASISTLIELGTSGPEICARLARRSLRGESRRTFLTLALFVYDAARRVGTLTNAGHPAPYRISQGNVDRLALPALPIGLMSQPVFPSKEFEFAPGDRLILFTDGIVEATDPGGDPFGYERLEALLASEASKTAGDLLAAILAAVAVHAGGAVAEDDCTLVLLAIE